MAIHKPYHRSKLTNFASPIFILGSLAACIVLIYLVSSLVSTNSVSLSSSSSVNDVAFGRQKGRGHEKYLYWGGRIDCPGKQCDTCAGLGHQESSLRCALEEALFLGRTFVMPSRMCLNPIHNKKGILDKSIKVDSDGSWSGKLCMMDSLYDVNLISSTIPVILDNTEIWHQILTTSMKLGRRGIANVQQVSRVDLKQSNLYSNVFLINRTASPLAWFAECKDRNNRSSVLLPHSFLPSMAATKLRNAADKIKSLLGDYDAMHVRRGDILKTRKDRYGVERTLHPHIDRDTRPEFILCRISKWIPPGRTIFIASNEMTPGFFSPLAVRYKLAYSSNFSSLLKPVIENNYQLFMLERLIMKGAKTFIGTYKESESDLSLTDDPKKNTKNWQIPVYTKEGTEC